MQVRLSNKSYEDAVGIATVNGRKKYHDQMQRLTINFADDDIVYALAVKDDTIVGVLAMEKLKNILGSFRQLTVKEELLESNIADALIAFMVNKAKEIGIMRLYVSVDDDADSNYIQTAARACKFKAIDIHKCDGGDKYLLCRDLVEEREIFNAMVRLAKGASNNPLLKMLLVPQ